MPGGGGGHGGEISVAANLAHEIAGHGRGRRDQKRAYGAHGGGQRPDDRDAGHNRAHVIDDEQRDHGVGAVGGLVEDHAAGEHAQKRHADHQRTADHGCDDHGCREIARTLVAHAADHGLRQAQGAEAHEQPGREQQRVGQRAAGVGLEQVRDPVIAQICLRERLHDAA